MMFISENISINIHTEKRMEKNDFFMKMKISRWGESIRAPLWDKINRITFSSAQEFSGYEEMREECCWKSRKKTHIQNLSISHSIVVIVVSELWVVCDISMLCILLYMVRDRNSESEKNGMWKIEFNDVDTAFQLFIPTMLDIWWQLYLSFWDDYK